MHNFMHALVVTIMLYLFCPYVGFADVEQGINHASLLLIPMLPVQQRERGVVAPPLACARTIFGFIEQL
jgi:hypothetical protein